MTRLVHWQEGMLMRVQNLQMLQQGFLERLEDVRRFQRHYPYGVIEAEIARDSLEAGKIRFVRLRALLRNGLEVNVPWESDLAALPVREEVAKSRSGEVTILLGVPDYSASHANAFRVDELSDARAKYRFIPRSEVRYDENTGDNKQAIVVRTLNARLLFDHQDKSGLECLPVVRVRRASAGSGSEFRVELAQGFVPPCLFVPPPADSRAGAGAAAGPQPILPDISLPHRLSEEVHLAVQKVEVARRLQSVRLRNQRLTMAALQGAQFQQWMRLLSLSRHAARLLALEQSACTTPFEMFMELNETLCEMEALRPRRNAAPGRELRENDLKYDHDDVFTVFSRLRSRLEKALLDVDVPDFREASFGPDPAGQNRVRATLGPQFFGPDVSVWYLSIQTPVSIMDLTPTMQNRQRFELATPTALDQGWGGLQLRYEADPPAGLPDAPDIHYFQVERPNDPILQQIWQSVETAGELGISRANSHLNLTNSSFTFYAILRPRALDVESAD